MRVGRSACGSISRAAARRRLEVRVELVDADLVDRVRVQVPERAQPDELVVASPPEGPVVGRGRQAVRDPGAVRLHRGVRPVDRPGEAGELGLAEDGLGGRADLREQRRQVPCVARLDLLPDRDLRTRGAALRGLEERGRLLEPVGDALQPLRQRGRAAREQEEDRVAHLARGEPGPLPAPDLLRVEQRRAQVVDLEVPLEARGRGEVRVIDRLDGGEVRPVGPDLVEDRVPARVPEPVVLGVDAEHRREDRVVLEQAADARLDEVVQPLVHRPGVGRGRGSRECHVGESLGHRSSGTRGSRRAATRGPARARVLRPRCPRARGRGPARSPGGPRRRRRRPGRRPRR